MSEELRELERAVAERGGVGERLKLARALERVGRIDDAVAALVPARDDAEARRELGRFPAWTHPRGDAGDSDAADVEPIRERPRAKWMQPVSAEGLVAGPIAIVAYGRTSPVLDAESGRVRWTCGTAFSPVGIIGDALYAVWPSGLRALDLWSGEPFFDSPIPTRCLAADARGVVCSPSEGRVLSFAVDDPRSPPKLTSDAKVDFGVSGHMRRCLLSRDHVAFEWRSGVVVLDRPTLAVTARARGRPIRFDEGRLVLAEASGLMEIDPATGRQLEPRPLRLPTMRLDAPASLVARARDVFVMTDRAGLFAESDGAELWRIPAVELPAWPIYHLAVTSRRVIAAGPSVFCLEPPA